MSKQNEKAFSPIVSFTASGIYGRLENEFDLYGKIGDYWSSSRSTESL